MASITYSGLNRSDLRSFAVVGALTALAIALWFFDVDAVIVFAASGIAVAGLAWTLGVATEEAGESAGPQISALLNATFGNAAEMIIVVLAVRAGLEEVALASIIGSVLGNLLLILGASIFICGWRHGRQIFDARLGGMNATMLLLAAAALAIPTMFQEAHPTNDGAAQNLTLGVAIVMIIMYAAYLFASFQSPGDTEAVAHGQARWSPRLAIIVLAVSAVLTGVLSEILVHTIEPTIESTGISPIFIGLIVIPLIGNVAEHLAAVKIAWGGNLDFAMGIAFNSALQVALAVSALAVAAGFFAPDRLLLAFSPLEIAVLIAATLLAAVIASNGTANWLEGAQLMAIYAIAGLVFWYV